jgi:hypothetical protein
MKTMMKNALATTALAAIAFAGAATTASAGTVWSSGVVRPSCGGPSGCTYTYFNHYLSFADCNAAGQALVNSGRYSDYYCALDTSDPSHGPWYDLFVA